MVYKRKSRSGKTTWSYVIELPGSTKTNRQRAWKHGFKTKDAAVKAEASRRVEENSGAGKGTIHQSLETLLTEFFADSTDLAPKTLERYRELTAYLSPELMQMPIREVTAMHLHKEWRRLAESGGHTRKDKTPRPLSAKTVRNVCGVVSAAYSRAMRWGLVQANPTTASDPPKVHRREGMALLPSQQTLMVEAARIPWMPAFLELAAATGCRRGELLALEWGDLHGTTLTITRSSTQTKNGLAIKPPKSGRSRLVVLPPSAITALENHRAAQQAYRDHFMEYQGNLIFANPDGTALRPDSVSSAVSALCRRLKLPKGVSLHTLRHSHGSQMLAAGVPLTDVSRRLGHSTTQTTASVYAHSLVGRDEEAAKKWEEFQKKDVPPKEKRQ